MKNKVFNPFPPLSDVIFILVFLIGCFHFKEILADGDTGYHIRAGDYMLASGTIPHVDIFSFHRPVFSWLAFEWLSDVIMALIHAACGLTGIVLFFVLMLSTTYWIFFKYMKSEFNSLVAVAATLLVIRTSMVHWLARPHVFSMLIIVLWYIVLNRYQYKNKNSLFLLPLIMLLWVNLHGGYIIGLFLLGIYSAGNLGTFFLGSDLTERKHALQKAKGFALIFAACLAAALFNPRGYEILILPFKVMSNKFLMDHTAEFASPSFHALGAYAVYLYLLIAVLGLCSQKLDFIEALIVLFFTHLSLVSVRHATLFAVMLAPIVAKRLYDAWRNARFKWKPGISAFGGRILAMDKAAIPVVWSLAVFFCVSGFIAVKDIHFDFSPAMKPVKAVQFLLSEKIPGHIFCSDEFGDYLVYKTWPEYSVFIDGRGEVYGRRILRQYEQIVSLKKPWKALLKKYNINWIIFPTGSSLTVALQSNADWKLIYSDKVASIFIQNSSRNNPWIEKHSGVKLASALTR